MANDTTIPRIHLQIKERIFGQLVHVLLNYDEVGYSEWKKRKGIRDDSNTSFSKVAGFAAAMEHPSYPNEYILLLRSFQWTLQDQGNLIHEIVHVIVKIWESNNIPHGPQTQEFLAHSVGHLYEDIAGKLKRYFVPVQTRSRSGNESGQQRDRKRGYHRRRQ